MISKAWTCPLQHFLGCLWRSFQRETAAWLWTDIKAHSHCRQDCPIRRPKSWENMSFFFLVMGIFSCHWSWEVQAFRILELRTYSKQGLSTSPDREEVLRALWFRGRHTTYIMGLLCLWLYESIVLIGPFHNSASTSCQFCPLEKPNTASTIPPQPKYLITKYLLRIILCVWVICLYVHVYVWYPWRSKEGVWTPGTSVTYNCELPCGGWQLNPGPLEVKSTGGNFCSGLALPILEWFPPWPWTHQKSN